MQRILLRMLSILFVICAIELTPLAIGQETAAIRFTSVPDIFNWNISNPQPGWEETLAWFFDRLQEEGPDFVLVAGDIMDARWWGKRRAGEDEDGGILGRI